MSYHESGSGSNLKDFARLGQGCVTLLVACGLISYLALETVQGDISPELAAAILAIFAAGVLYHLTKAELADRKSNED